MILYDKTHRTPSTSKFTVTEMLRRTAPVSLGVLSGYLMLDT